MQKEQEALGDDDDQGQGEKVSGGGGCGEGSGVSCGQRGRAMEMGGAGACEGQGLDGAEEAGVDGDGGLKSAADWRR